MKTILSRTAMVTALLFSSGAAYADPVAPIISPSDIANLQAQGADVNFNGNDVTITSPRNIDLSDIRIVTPGNVTITSDNIGENYIEPTVPTWGPGPPIYFRSDPPTVIISEVAISEEAISIQPLNTGSVNRQLTNVGNDKTPQIAKAVVDTANVATLSPSAGGGTGDEAADYGNAYLAKIGMGRF